MAARTVTNIRITDPGTIQAVERHRQRSGARTATRVAERLIHERLAQIEWAEAATEKSDTKAEPGNPKT